MSVAHDDNFVEVLVATSHHYQWEEMLRLIHNFWVYEGYATPEKMVRAYARRHGRVL